LFTLQNEEESGRLVQGAGFEGRGDFMKDLHHESHPLPPPETSNVDTINYRTHASFHELCHCHLWEASVLISNGSDFWQGRKWIFPERIGIDQI
jgi:hypothetical protein